MLCGLLLAASLGQNPTTEEALALADSAFVKVDYPRAIAMYDRLLQGSPALPAVLWRLSRVYISIGDVMPREDREPVYRRAEAYARECIKADSTRSEGHTWLAASLGNLAMVVSDEEKVMLTNEIKSELETAIALNPEDDVAYSILGSFYRALGNIGWFERVLANIFLGSIPSGGYEESEIAIQKAIQLAPNILRHQFELVLLYRDWGKEKEARAALERASTLPVLVASDIPTQERIKQMLEEPG
jgi:tetratricopeptide (TPR) repeat protein